MDLNLSSVVLVDSASVNKHAGKFGPKFERSDHYILFMYYWFHWLLRRIEKHLTYTTKAGWNRAVREGQQQSFAGSWRIFSRTPAVEASMGWIWYHSDRIDGGHQGHCAVRKAAFNKLCDGVGFFIFKPWMDYLAVCTGRKSFHDCFFEERSFNHGFDCSPERSVWGSRETKINPTVNDKAYA